MGGTRIEQRHGGNFRSDGEHLLNRHASARAHVRCDTGGVGAGFQSLPDDGLDGQLPRGGELLGAGFGFQGQTNHRWYFTTEQAPNYSPEIARCAGFSGQGACRARSYDTPEH